MSGFFIHEDARAAKLRYILQENGIHVTTSTITSKGHHFRTDGAIEFCNCHISIFKAEGEIGTGGAEPYAQAILYYAHSAWEKSEKHPTFNFPWPHISFSGAVWRTRPHFQVLTPAIPLFCHDTDTDTRGSLARHLGAFKKAIRSLEECYEAALTNPTLLKNLNPQFPDPCTYLSPATKTSVNFKYLCQIDEKRQLFIGEDRQWGEDLHQIPHEKCATMGIAPKLRGFEDIGAGWKMVIMDALDMEYKPFDKNVLPADTHEHIEAQLAQLHQAHFVHGDVRTVNVMIRKDGKPGFMLVDFDWSGVIGEVYYPMNVNKVDHWRPEDVSDALMYESAIGFFGDESESLSIFFVPTLISLEGLCGGSAYVNVFYRVNQEPPDPNTNHDIEKTRQEREFKIGFSWIR
ncbi:hypothetical protein BYT27DRAFT_7253936 [Phlegmacium glaucopus]|nr:hypothetical protein BYT27DRAFT_7253936 [Phlegmacium glaucopus]